MNPAIFKKLFILLFFPVMLSAQGFDDYSILLKSGKFIPENNAAIVTKESDVFLKSFFDGKHYVTVQFNLLPDQATKERLAVVGVKLIDYIPNMAFTAAIDAGLSMDVLKTFSVRSIFQFTTEQKTIPELMNGIIPAHAIKSAGYADMTVITYEKIDGKKIHDVLISMDATILEEMPVFRSFTIRIAKDNILRLAGLPFVQWVEPIEPPNKTENILGRTLHRVNVLNDGFRNLKGGGIRIGVWDSGEVSPHLDFLPASRLNQIEFNAASQHSTHVAGTIGGRGLIDPRAKGMAPDADIYSYNYNGDVQVEMAAAIPLYNLVVSSHSYGGSVSSCDINGSQIQYSSRSRSTDINLNNFPNHLHVHSSGNSQASCTGGWFTITGSGKTAKNNILVANISSSEGLSSTSSCGPTQDGRIKPEISAFGSSVLSTSTPLNAYATLSGTSMATPGVSGSVSLLVERYKQLNDNTLPVSSLIKNTVLNTAHDLGNPGPDYRFGYGRINALSAVRILEENRYSVNSVSLGGSNDVIINVPADAARLRVMLTWNDPAGATNANPALVNNLNLSVINGVNTTLPWILDKNNPSNVATRGVDNYSNVEQVTIDNPPSGNYTLRVEGFFVPSGPQQYALTWSIDQPYIEVIYPNGNEGFNPGTSQTITWDNAGVVSNQTVEYSLNNGASWTTINSSVSPLITRLSWTVPTANTSTALIRVSSNELSDISDAGFNILGTVTNLNSSAACMLGGMTFTWTAVTNATHYDIYGLKTGTGEWEILAVNATGTSHTVTGLTPGASMWFTITSKNNATGAVSEKALAINRTVSTSGLPPVGEITGGNDICEIRTDIPYSIASVPGATSYTWSVPAGASIVSGQGNTSILVNFPCGSSSGDVTVFASTATCQTDIVSKTVTVNPCVTAGTVNGASSQCIGATETYTSNGSTGGTWSSSNTSVATINASTGLLTSVSSGATNIAYTINSGCGSPVSSFKSVTVSNITAGTVSGNSQICLGTTDSYTSNGTSGGTWSSSNTLVATVNASSGLITPVGDGTTDIIYTLSSGCVNPVSASKTLTVSSRVLMPVKTFLQGAYSSSLTRHKDVTTTWAGILNTNALSQPFILAPFNYAGTESVSSGFFTSTAATTDILDWVLVELRDAATPATIISRHAAFIREDGRIVEVDGVSDVSFINVPNGNYYMVILHRNHMGIRTSAVRVYNTADCNSLPAVYDFSISQSQAFQNIAITGNTAQKNLTGGIFGMWGGNVNSDGQVRATGLGAQNDFLSLLTAMGFNPGVVINNIYSRADLNLDGTIRASGLSSVNDYLSLLGALDNNPAKVINQHQ